MLSLFENSACGDCEPPDLVHAPRGTTYSANWNGFVVSATTRSAEALLLVPFTIFWLTLMLIAIYNGRQSGHGPPALIVIPLGIAFLIRAALQTAGKVVVSSDRTGVTVFEGIGAIGWKRRFAWKDAESIHENQLFQAGSGPVQCIEVTFAYGARKPLRFGSLLSAGRRGFLFSVLRYRWAGVRTSGA